MFDSHWRRIRKATILRESISRSRHLDREGPAFLHPADHAEVLGASKQAGKPKPLVNLDVNLGRGRKGILHIREGDDSLELAAQFAAEHGLSASVQDKLVSIIEAQVAKFIHTRGKGGTLTNFH